MTIHPARRKPDGEQPSVSHDHTGMTKTWPPHARRPDRRQTMKNRLAAIHQLREGNQDMHPDIDTESPATDRISHRTPSMILSRLFAPSLVSMTSHRNVNWDSSTTDSGVPFQRWHTWNFTWSATVNGSTVTHTVTHAVTCVLFISTRWSTPRSARWRRCGPVSFGDCSIVSHGARRVTKHF